MPVISTIAAATARAFGAFKSAAGGAADEFFKYVTLLLHGDGTNGAQNNTFLDSSTNNFTITRNGNTTQGTFSPFSQDDGKWGAYFDGSGDYLDIGSASNWVFLNNGSDWTIEFDVYHTSTSLIVPISTFGPSNQVGISIQMNSTVANDVAVSFGRGVSGSVAYFNSTANLIVNKWNHVGITFTSSTKTCAFYINGVASGSSSNTGFSYSASNPTNTLRVGVEASSGSYGLTGYLSNIRISNSVRTGMTSVPTTPYSSDGNTSLLTCQSNRFKDNSSNNFAITVNGNTSVQAFSPFAPTAAYSAATVGGSGYFDGSGDYITAPDNAAWDFGTGDFTVETWVYPTTSGTTRVIGSAFSNSGNDGWSFELTSSNTLTFYAEGSYRATSTGTVAANAWNHVAVSRSGTSLRLFINGVLDGSATDSTNISGSTAAITISATPSGTVPFTGYQSNFRVVTGTAVYTSAFTPPTAPLTAISGTSLLLNFTNGGIIDNTAKNVLETVGNAQISTSVKKFGTGSLAFDGTGDYLVTAPSNDNILGSGDFTIEMWLYPANTSAAYRAIIASDAYAGTTNGWTVYQNGSSIEMYYAQTGGGSTPNIFTATSALTATTWQHFALSRSSGTLKAFVNGTQVASVSNTISFAGSRIFVADNNAGDYFFNGYIDDLRITKGVARYTTTFTPPTAAFADQ